MRITKKICEEALGLGVGSFGYHYTSKSNWDKIQISGLTPYFIKKDGLNKYYPAGVNGVWVWKSEPKGRSNTGAILWQVATKKDLRVVKLRVRYSTLDVLCFRGKKLLLSHEGVFGDFVYHDNEQAYIITRTIYPKDIEVVKEYDLTTLLA